MLKAMIASETDAEKLAALGHERLGCTRAEEAKNPKEMRSFQVIRARSGRGSPVRVPGGDAYSLLARCKPEMAHRDPTAWLCAQSYANRSRLFFPEKM